MTVRQFQVSGIRNLAQTRITALGDVNLIFGANGSGKTSLLESLYMLGVTRSFRSRKMDAVINREADSAVVWGEIAATGGHCYRVGIERHRRNRPMVRLNGNPVASLGELAGILPLQVINADSFKLLEGPPVFRRELLDWGVFHVEHRNFFSVWQRYRRALQQRNSLLRRGKIAQQEIEVWNKELVNGGELLHRYRETQYQKLAGLLGDVYRSIADADDDDAGRDITFDYYPGWDVSKPLAQELSAGQERDLRLGYTRLGPHRADIRIKVGGVPAAEILSRGQIKTLVCAARIAQAKLLQQYGINSVFLIDDLPAELDSARRRAICQAVTGMGLQLFVTSIKADDLDDCWHGISDIRRFHVEHGRVAPAQ